MTACPTCHHPAHEWTCTAPVDAGNVYEGFCQCRNSRHEIAGPADTSAVLARVKCPECGNPAIQHSWRGDGCPLSQSQVLAAHIAALEARVAGDEARIADLEHDRREDESRMLRARNDLEIAAGMLTFQDIRVRLRGTMAAIDARLGRKDKEEQ